MTGTVLDDPGERGRGGMTVPPVLEAQGLVKIYQGSTVPALRNFSLCVASAQCYGLLGPNGAGKTTAMSILSGLLNCDSGSLSILGLDPHRHSPALRRLIGVVPQHIALYEKLTGRENLAFFGRLYGLGGIGLQRRLRDCLELVELASHGDLPVSGYSGGMKRRLNLAAGLLGEPRILFLDEPTVGIDIQSRHLIYQRLHELKQSGTTIFYTTHYLKEAEELCDRVGIIDRGCMVIEGSPNELLADNQAADLDALLLALSGPQPRDD